MCSAASALTAEAATVAGRTFSKPGDPLLLHRLLLGPPPPDAQHNHAFNSVRMRLYNCFQACDCLLPKTLTQPNCFQACDCLLLRHLPPPPGANMFMSNKPAYAVLCLDSLPASNPVTAFCCLISQICALASAVPVTSSRPSGWNCAAV